MFASFHPLWLLRSTSSIILVHLLTIGTHPSHWLLHVFQVRANAPCGRYSLKAEAILLQKLTFLWSAPTIGSAPTFMHARISCWPSWIVHFFAPPIVPSITSSTSPSSVLASMFVLDCTQPDYWSCRCGWGGGVAPRKKVIWMRKWRWIVRRVVRVFTPVHIERFVMCWCVIW